MSSTNKTVTIELSQYVGTDKPTYLTDYNGDMLKIDNAIAADRDSIATAQNTADGAVAKADANKDSIDTINAEIEGSGTTPGIATRLSDAEGDIDTIQELIGNGTPTAGDHTLIGAINELAEIVGDVESLTTIDKSSLVAAINELNAKESGVSIEHVDVAYDNTKTLSALLDELFAAVDNVVFTATSGVFLIESIVIDTLGVFPVGARYVHGTHLADTKGVASYSSATDITIQSVDMNVSNSTIRRTGVVTASITDLSANVIGASSGGIHLNYVKFT